MFTIIIKKMDKKKIIIITSISIIAVGIICYFVFFNKPKITAETLQIPIEVEFVETIETLNCNEDDDNCEDVSDLQMIVEENDYLPQDIPDSQD